MVTQSLSHCLSFPCQQKWAGNKSEESKPQVLDQHVLFFIMFAIYKSQQLNYQIEGAMQEIHFWAVSSFP